MSDQIQLEVESGEGIESEGADGHSLSLACLWNPVKELKAKG